MTDEDIQYCLTNLFNIDVNKKDLVECKPEFVQKIYTYFLKDFGASLDKINQVPVDAPSSISNYPDMFKSACFIIGLAKTINYYISLIYRTTSDFGINDLIQPNRSRTKKFFNLLIEFYSHVYQNIGDFEGIENEAAQEKINFDALRNRITDLVEEIGQRQLKNAEYEICLQKEMEQLSQAQREFERIQCSKIELKEKMEFIKSEIKSVKSKIKKTELEILEGKEQIQILESQVMQDEELAEIKEQESILTLLKNSNAELKNQLLDFNRILQDLKEKEKFISSSMIALLEEIELEYVKNKDAESSAETFKKTTEVLTEKLKDLLRSQKQYLENCNLLQEKQATLRKGKEIKNKGLIDEINQLRLNASELQNSLEKQSSEEREIIAEVSRIKEEFKIKEEKLRIFISHVEISFANIIDQINGK